MDRSLTTREVQEGGFLDLKTLKKPEPVGCMQSLRHMKQILNLLINTTIATFASAPQLGYKIQQYCYPNETSNVIRCFPLFIIFNLAHLWLKRVENIVNLVLALLVK